VKTAHFRYVDANNRIAVHSLQIDDSKVASDLATLRTKLQALSNASLKDVWVDEPLPDFTDGDVVVNGAFSVWDKAHFLFRAGKAFVTLSIPAPVVAIFNRDETINAAHILASAVIEAALVVLQTKLGVDVVSFVRGWREKKPGEAKIN